MKVISDLHTHTMASTHAYSTINENCESAGSRGIKIIAMTDHAPQMPDGTHEWHIGNQCVLPQIIKGVCVLKGVEADIMNPAGEIDVADYVLSGLQWIVASFHTPVYAERTEDEHLETILNVCKNPAIDVFGHLTTVSHRFDYAEGAKLFAKYDKIVEVNEASINAGRSTRENVAELLKECKKNNVKLSLDSDAHYCDGIGVVNTAAQLVKEAGYPKELIINNNYEYIVSRVNENHPNAPKIDMEAIKNLIYGQN